MLSDETEITALRNMLRSAIDNLAAQRKETEKFKLEVERVALERDTAREELSTVRAFNKDLLNALLQTGGEDVYPA